MLLLAWMLGTAVRNLDPINVAKKRLEKFWLITTFGICRSQGVIHPFYTSAVSRAGSEDPLHFDRDVM